jgi:ATP-dependent Zn protease
MNGDIKRYIYIIGTICVVFFAVSILFRILPWLLLVGVISYIITKIVRFIKGKSEERDSSKFENSKDDQYNYNITCDDYTNGEVIDVEYEDIDNKKD